MAGGKRPARSRNVLGIAGRQRDTTQHHKIEGCRVRFSSSLLIEDPPGFPSDHSSSMASNLALRYMGISEAPHVRSPARATPPRCTRSSPPALHVALFQVNGNTPSAPLVAVSTGPYQLTTPGAADGSLVTGQGVCVVWVVPGSLGHHCRFPMTTSDMMQPANLDLACIWTWCLVWCMAGRERGQPEINHERRCGSRSSSYSPSPPSWDDDGAGRITPAVPR
ncbi:hypothetical protein EsH8_VI_000223 [Colletotrichum jinshuiense]